MQGWLIALIAVLIVHYFCAIFTIWLLLQDKLTTGRVRKAPLIGWNLFILFVPLLGAACYLTVRTVQKRRAKREAPHGTDGAPAAENQALSAQENDAESQTLPLSESNAENQTLPLSESNAENQTLPLSESNAENQALPAQEKDAVDKREQTEQQEN